MKELVRDLGVADVIDAMKMNFNTEHILFISNRLIRLVFFSDKPLLLDSIPTPIS